MKISWKYEKKNWIWIGIWAAVELLVGILAGGWNLLFSAGAIAITFGLMNLKVEISDKWQFIPGIITMLIAPVITVYMAQYVILFPENFGRIKNYKLILNFILVLFLYLIVLLATNRTILAITITHSTLLVFAFADYFMYTFRQNEFVFSDLKATKTGLSVLGNYKLQLHGRGAIALLATCIFFLLVYRFRVKFKHRIPMSIVSVLACVFCGVYLCANTNKINTETWQQKGTYKNGYYLNFALSVRDNFVAPPEGYSVDEIEALEDEYDDGGAEYALEGVADVENPTVICIMSESFADLSVVGDIDTNVDLTPFMDSLIENTTRGYALSSVYGAKTPNSEWEFMTGNSMAFLPTGSVVYQQYIRDDATSLVSIMSNYGYTCVAMHPYNSTGWSRNSVYPNLGFDEMYFLDDYPQEYMVRDYVSDQEFYEQIIARFEQKEEDENLFMMNISMQNHGGYTTSYENFVENIYKTGTSYTDANQYLSLVHESDQALEYLISYFENVDEPVVIVLFGDHQPSLSSGFIELLNGKGLSNLTEEEQQNLYTVPFFIWTNYDTPEEEVQITSLNYLSYMTLQRAGLELTPYEQFLCDMSQVVPAINSNGYYSLTNGTYMNFEDATGEEAEWILRYQMLQYNSMFDSRNQSDLFFPYLDDAN